MRGLKHYVIIGNGIAAVGCIEGIRSKDAVNPITVVSSEPFPAYGRPLISYYLAGKTNIKKMIYRPEDFYESNGVKVLYGKSAKSFDPAAKTVLLSDGEELSYSELLIATGSVPFVPRFQGIETVKNKSCFMTIEDSLSVEESLSPEAKVLIIGAGFIGLKCAEGIKGRAKSIMVADLAGHILPSILDDDSAPYMEKILTDNEIELLLGDTALRFDGNRAYMQSGKVIDFDYLVLAVGVRPAATLFSEAGGAMGKGITINEKGETSLPSVYAAGDCTESMDISCGEISVTANLPSAYMQGRTAGVNMAGGIECYDKGIKMNSIGFFGLHVISAGTRTDETLVYEAKSDSSLKKLYAKDGVLTGYMLVGDVERAGVYTALIRNRTPLDSFDFEKMKQIPSLAPFGSEARKNILGGVV